MIKITRINFLAAFIVVFQWVGIESSHAVLSSDMERELREICISKIKDKFAPTAEQRASICACVARNHKYILVFDQFEEVRDYWLGRIPPSRKNDESLLFLKHVDLQLFRECKKDSQYLCEQAQIEKKKSEKGF